ncbi:GNAT family N-acetyltransferase [Tenggerimyces flavus]|uniref:GNAT family N-acetyltransferase n=1 Tax=Tenggerimyces flavus TaxID=1708749 RepID=A0ABV7YM28_9ACTN|nr:GNAT family N-acetyltransferase [Tenggerimyces flavus]MBM7789375.1 GNAT superfamily N-acetyltransferase [Tenggerimyces flavus]
MTVVKVRRASAEDVPALATLRRAWTEEQNGEVVDPNFEARFAEWFATESGRRVAWIASVDDRPIGMLNLAVFTRMPRPGVEPNRWGYIANVFVLEAHRDSGVGRLLVEEAVTFARDEDLVRLVLSPSPRSVPFYERAGFATTDRLMMWTPKA